MPMRQLADGTWYNTDDVPAGQGLSSPMIGDPNLVSRMGFEPTPWEDPLVHSDIYNSIIGQARDEPGFFDPVRRDLGFQNLNRWSPEEILAFLASEESQGIGDAGRAHLFNYISGGGQTGVQMMNDYFTGLQPAEQTSNTPPGGRRQTPTLIGDNDGPSVVLPGTEPPPVPTEPSGLQVTTHDEEDPSGRPYTTTPVGVEVRDTPDDGEQERQSRIFDAVATGIMQYGYTDQGLLLRDPNANVGQYDPYNPEASYSEPIVVTGDQVEAVYRQFIDPETGQPLSSFEQLMNMYGYETAFAVVTAWVGGTFKQPDIPSPAPPTR